MPAITHVAVTVTDLAASEAWYTKVLGVKPVLPDLVSKEPFNERKPGLDHIAFGVASRDELAEWAARLDELGVAHGDIVDAGYGSGLSVRDPDNIALELFAPPALPADGELSRLSV
jgi:catechol 2,3-dioxygenase-like lactoylglutathione lyase family enzyme